MIICFHMREKIKKVLPVLVIIATAILAYGQTLRMYFWQDDSAIIFKLQHLQGAAGSFGEGIIGSGPYKYLISFFVPFFPFFKLEPFYYFLVGALSYLIVVFVFSFLAKELFKDVRNTGSKIATFFATLVFAAGYVGSDIMFRISNSWQSNLGLILAVLSLTFFIKSIKERNSKLIYYLLSLFLFWACTEFVYVRSHSLVFPILAIGILVAGYQLKIRKILFTVLRQIPFWLIFYVRYLKGESMGSSALTIIINNLLHGKLETLTGFIATIGNGFVPDILQSRFIRFFPNKFNLFYLLLFAVITWVIFSFFRLEKSKKYLVTVFLFLGYLLNRHFISQDLYWYGTKEAFIAGASGIYASILLIFLTIYLWKKYKVIATSIILGYLIFVSQLFGYFIQYPDSIFATTHRYLNYPFIGYSLVIAGVSYALFKVSRKTGIFLLSGVVITNLILGVHYQLKIIKNRSIPTRNFYINLKSFVPSVTKGTAFYFDVQAEPFLRQQFNDFFSVGSMPNTTALAIYYGVDRYDIKMFTELDELLYKLSTKDIDIGNLYTFYYGKEGLVDTTSYFRQALVGKSREPFVGTPVELKIPIKVNLDDSVSYPYSFSGKNKRDFTLEEKGNFILYFDSRLNYYRNVHAESLSEWKFQEITNVIDNNADTSWRGHRIYWHDNNHEEIVIDLGSIKNINKLIWVNWIRTLVPISYKIEVLQDKKQWFEVKNISNGPKREDGEKVIESFDRIDARFVKLSIMKTQSGDAPAISEIEIVESKYNFTISKAFEFLNNPFSYIENFDEMKTVLSCIYPFLNIRVSWETDKGNAYYDQPIKNINKFYNFTGVFAPGGTKLINLDMSIKNAPLVIIKHNNLLLRNPSLSELEKSSLIKKLSEN